MGEESGGDFNRLVNDLAKLQSRWERKLTNPGKRRQEMWARGVLFGIETGRATVGEDNRRSVAELNALLIQWEGIRTHAEANLVEETIRGLDFGIRLVIGRVRRSLSARLDENPARPKPPTSADSRKARSGQKHRPDSRA